MPKNNPKMTAKKQYALLLKQGLLLEGYEGLTGDWVQDKEMFESIYELELSFISNVEFNDEEYEF